MTDVKMPAWLQNMQFITSAAKLKQCPADHGIEIAFVGRSNVGKSSVLNALTNRRNLAKTSKTPGRTQLINFFGSGSDDDNVPRLVDLPGYGFAKVSQTQRQQWDRLIAEYLEQRESLAGLVLIMDIRHPMKETDQQIISWVAEAQVPLLVVLNKMDKLTKQEAQKTFHQVKKELNHYAEGIECMMFSAMKKTNMVALFDIFDAWCS